MRTKGAGRLPSWFLLALASKAMAVSGPLSAKLEVIQISAGNSHVCAILSDHRLKCWGENTNGQLGYEDNVSRGNAGNQMGQSLPFVKLGNERKVVSISCGRDHSCAILDDHSVKCWGSNDSGQLGLGDTRARGAAANTMGDNLPAVNLGAGRTALALATGSAHTCALLDNHLVKCWGSNSDGNVGFEISQLGDGADQMGDKLPYVSLGTTISPSAAASLFSTGGLNLLSLAAASVRPLRVISLSAGTSQTCAILENRDLKCWGDNGSGQLGIGTTDSHGRTRGEMGDALPRVDLGTGRYAVTVNPGDRYTCAELDDGSVKCWGQNSRGQLGQGNGNSAGDRPETMGDKLPPVSLFPDLGAESIHCGKSGQCCATSRVTHLLKCWGENSAGALGLEVSDPGIGMNRGEMGDALPYVDLGPLVRVSDAAVGSDFVCAILNNGQVKCWGQNGSGQLGMGKTDRFGQDPGTMGSQLPYVELQ